MEQTTLLEDVINPEPELASTGQRFVNYLIDILVFYGVIIIFGMLAGAGLAASDKFSEGATEEDVQSAFLGGVFLIYAFVFGFLFLYYTLLEGSKGKTLGKMVTKTRVIREDGEPMTYGKAFLRTLCRMVPFEPLSIFFGMQMWHDKWTGTVVVKDNK
jgi:uncharacterized RDD family membrane protein YckC